MHLASIGVDSLNRQTLETLQSHKSFVSKRELYVNKAPSYRGVFCFTLQ